MIGLDLIMLTFIFWRENPFTTIGLSIIGIITLVTFFTSQYLCAIFYIFPEHLLLNRPLRFFFKNHIIKYNDIDELVFRGPGLGASTERILIKYKSIKKRKVYPFAAVSIKDIQTVIDKLRELGVIVKVENGLWE